MTIEFTAIFCDDIREETNGKLLLIGVYSGDLIPGVVPGSFPLSLMVKAHGLTGKHKFEVTVTSPGDNQVTMGGDIDVPSEVRAFPLIFAGFPINLASYGEITADITLDDGEATRIGRLAVTKPQGT